MQLILHIPHASTRIPARYRRTFLLTDAQLNAELLAMTDRFTDTLFPTNYPRVIFPVSRLLCDPERFRQDEHEQMAVIGMGAIYTRGSQLQVIRVNPNREELLEKYYDPHHLLLEQTVAQELNAHNQVLILDCHSFSNTVLPYEQDKNPIRPDICIGTDAYHTPKALETLAHDFFSSKGLSVKVNSPYSGALVPSTYYNKDVRVKALMLEINRSLYMDAKGNKTGAFTSIQSLLAKFTAILAQI
ncbi:MAG: N-formylglutamate amidohydrolase [Sphaerochaetaceae bacterium]|nr:N-formylglutamate amidohydrolase [Sphaerochaetaceae bacterium]